MESRDHKTVVMVMHHLPLFKQVLFADFRDLFRDYPDINQTHMQSLMFLMINGDTTMTQLSRLIHLEKGSVTAVVARLLEWGLVSKETDPTDRRRSILRLNTLGRSLAASVRSAQAVHFNERIDRLDENEQKQFFSHLKKLNDLMKKMADPDQLRCFFPEPGQDGCHHHSMNADRQTQDDPIEKTSGGFTHA